MRGVEKAQNNITTFVCCLHSASNQGNYPQTSTSSSWKNSHDYISCFLCMEKKFHRSQLDWRYRVSILVVDKLLKNYELQRKAMAQWCVYLVMPHNIPHELVLNTNQIGIHIFLHMVIKHGKQKVFNMWRSVVWKINTKLFVAISLATNDQCLPFQLIFQGTTSRGLPHWMLVELHVFHFDWHLTLSHNH